MPVRQARNKPASDYGVRGGFFCAVKRGKMEMEMKYEMTETELQESVENFRGVTDSELQSELSKFEKAKINSALYVTLRFDPKTGKFWISEDTEWSCSPEEYFNEYGPASVLTVESGQSSWTPGPDDGFEWEENEDGDYYGNFDTGDWFSKNSLSEKAEEMEGYDDLPAGADLEDFVKKNGYVMFSVSSNPVEPEDFDTTEYFRMFSDLADECEKLIEEMNKEEDEEEENAE